MQQSLQIADESRLSSLDDCFDACDELHYILQVSADEAARIATDGVKKLIASRRLVLVLDLDHTLLNTVRDGDLRGPEREAALKIIQQQKDAMQRYQQNGQSTASADGTAAEEETDTALKAEQQQQNRSPTPQLYHLADKGLWTKLRPGVEQFLAAVAPLYELHIYTMGDKGYAGLMADLLDPEHKLFVGRVISAVSAAPRLRLLYMVTCSSTTADEGTLFFLLHRSCRSNQACC